RHSSRISPLGKFSDVRLCDPDRPQRRPDTGPGNCHSPTHAPFAVSNGRGSYQGGRPQCLLIASSPEPHPTKASLAFLITLDVMPLRHPEQFEHQPLKLVLDFRNRHRSPPILWTVSGVRLHDLIGR